jgi:hypothetical protein
MFIRGEFSADEAIKDGLLEDCVLAYFVHEEDRLSSEPEEAEGEKLIAGVGQECILGTKGRCEAEGDAHKAPRWVSREASRR